MEIYYNLNFNDLEEMALPLIKFCFTFIKKPYKLVIYYHKTLQFQLSIILFKREKKIEVIYYFHCCFYGFDRMC